VDAGSTKVATTTTPDGLRERSARFLDRLQSSEHRDLTYTIVAIAIIVLLGAIIVPLTVSRSTTLPLASDAQSLAQQYLADVVKVKGVTPPADAATVVHQYGTDGGTTCSSSLADLYQSAIVTPKPAPGTRGASHLDRTKLEQTRVALRVYCPKRDAQLARFLKHV
jgi:hypothetical protein